MTHSSSRGCGFRNTALAAVVGWLVAASSSYGYEGPWALFFDWSSDPAYYVPGSGRSPRMDQLGFQLVHTKHHPQPHLANWAWDNATVLQMYDRLVREKRPVSFMLHSPMNCPLTGAKKDALPNTLAYLSGKGYRLDYLHMDFELDGGFPTDRNNAEVAEAVRQVRTHADPRINRARIGAFDLYPVSSITYFPYPKLNGKTNTDLWNHGYASTGVNVAMPNMYPWEYLEMHTHADLWGSDVAPNKRSALFWAPLEQLSAVKRVLPAGHQLVPYPTDFVPWKHLAGYTDTYDAPPPPRKDNVALLQHARLRGADGYYLYATAKPADMEQYRGDMLQAWESLDWLFAGGQAPKILNLETNKRSGLQWSGAVTNNGIAILVSNLGNSAATFTMPKASGFDGQLSDRFDIAPGEHRIEIRKLK